MDFTFDTPVESAKKRPVGRPRKVPRTEEEEEELRRRQIASRVKRQAFKAQMRQGPAAMHYNDDATSYYYDDDDDDEDDDFSDSSEVVKQVRPKYAKPGRPRLSVAANPIESPNDKAVMCRPICHHKRIMCFPVSVDQSEQCSIGGNPNETRVYVPVPIPILSPAPLIFSNVPTPFPLSVPMPVVYPQSIQHCKEKVDTILEELKTLHDNLPPDEEGKTPDQSDNEKLADILKRFQLAVISRDEAQASAGESEVTEDNNELPEEELNDEEHLLMKRIRKESMFRTQKLNVVPRLPVRQVIPDDGNMRLKYTYGINAYRHWAAIKNVELEAARAELLQKDKQNLPPFKPVKKELLQCSQTELCFYLSSFVKEFRKPTDESYSADTIYYFCMGIRYYLLENGWIDDIFYDECYSEFIGTLHFRLAESQPMLDASGYLVCRVSEEHLWEAKILGVHSPYTLLETLIYFNTKNFLLFDESAHYGLSFTNIIKQSKRNTAFPGGKITKVESIRYVPTASMQTVGGNNTSYEHCENAANPLRCPVKLYEFYLSKCLEHVKQKNDVFYLQPEPSCTPSSPIWFTTSPIDPERLTVLLERTKIVKEVRMAMASHGFLSVNQPGAVDAHDQLSLVNNYRNAE